MKVLGIPKLMKHLTPQQSLGAIQYISMNLDSNNMRTPTVDEKRSFMYLQELVFIFAKKEKKEKPRKCTYLLLIHSSDLSQFLFLLIVIIFITFLISINGDLATKKNDKKHRGSEDASESKEDEDSDESSTTSPEKKVKSKKSTQAKGKNSVTSR
jgi:hypothetical protein